MLMHTCGCESMRRMQYADTSVEECEGLTAGRVSVALLMFGSSFDWSHSHPIVWKGPFSR